MPSFTTTLLTTLALTSTLISAAPVAAPVEARGQPAGWATDYLEPYATYHTRYLALDCQDKHETSFFAACCHPLLKGVSLSTRPDYCTPTAAASSSAATVADVTTSTTVTAQAAINTAAAPVTTTSTTPAYVAPTTTSTKAAAATTTAASSSGGKTIQYGGFATYFYQGGNAGECGTVHSDSDYVIAIDSNGWWGDYQSNSNSPYCGKWITLTNTNNGKSVTAMVADVCPTCDTNNSLDLSVAAFQAIASESDGMVPITWYWA